MNPTVSRWVHTDVNGVRDIRDGRGWRIMQWSDSAISDAGSLYRSAGITSGGAWRRSDRALRVALRRTWLAMTGRTRRRGRGYRA